MNSCLVSIIIPVYNSEKYIIDCIDSCINQTYNNIEIIIIDDGSNDNSYQLCKQKKKKRQNNSSCSYNGLSARRP